MVGQPWLADTLAVAMLATAAYCAVRLAVSHIWRRGTERDVDLMHVVMGVAMAGMLVSRLNPFTNQVWEGAFGVATAWFGWRIAHDFRGGRMDRRAVGHHVPHLLACVAMLYMLTAVSGGLGATLGPAPRAAMDAAMGRGSGSPGAPVGIPALTVVLAVALLGSVVWTADRLTPAPAGTPGGAAASPQAASAGDLGASHAAAVRDNARPPGGKGGRWPKQAPAVGVAAHGAASGVTAHGAASGVTAHGAASGVTAHGAASGVTAHGAAAGHRRGHTPLAPRVAACCQIVMGITMGYMLVLML